MPTYSYACTACEHRFDVQQSFTDDALTVCQDCGGQLRKLFGNVGVVFKGSGFYRTDSRKDGSRTSGRRSTTTSGSDASTGPASGSGSSTGSGASTGTSGPAATSGSAGSGSTGSAGSSGTSGSTSSKAATGT